jgi:hypothetical protein
MTTEQWADRINAARHKSIESTFAVGRMLIDAKKELGHGNFHRLFRGQPNAVENPVPMDVRMGEYYMAVAERFGTIKTKLVSFLPTSVSILYVLSELDSDVMETLINTGTVHPGLTRIQARALVRPVGTTETPWYWEGAEYHLRHTVNNAIQNMSGEERASFAALMRGLADEVEQSLDTTYQADVEAALDSLAIHDAEPGGYLVLEDESAARCHPGGPTVVMGVPSTYAPWYKDITTKKDGVTPLTRKQVEDRLFDMRAGRLPTKKTMRTFHSVAWAIKGAARARRHAKEA